MNSSLRVFVVERNTWDRGRSRWSRHIHEKAYPTYEEAEEFCAKHLNKSIKGSFQKVYKGQEDGAPTQYFIHEVVVEVPDM